VQSVLEIRHFLTAELGKLDGKSELSASLREMGAALPEVSRSRWYEGWPRRSSLRRPSRTLGQLDVYSSLAEMRGTFGVGLAPIAAQFRLDIEDQLAAILPAKDEGDSE
jgi:hypothetical protein